MTKGMLPQMGVSKPAMFEGELNSDNAFGQGMFANTREGWRLLGSVGHYSDFSDADGNPLTATKVTGYEYEESATFVVTSVNSTGEESDNSNEASGTTPGLDAPTGLSAVEGDGYVNLSWSYDGYEAPAYPNCNGTLSWIGDGWCDSGNNNPECEYDGGDCCAATCDDGGQDLYGCDECDADGDGSGCGAQSDGDGDGLWDSCFDPDGGGGGIPTCDGDYQFAVFTGMLGEDCSSDYQTVMTITYNAGCTGIVHVDGVQTYTSAPPIYGIGYYDDAGALIYFGPSETHTFDLYVDGELVATETETTSDVDCNAQNPYPDCAGYTNWINDGYCDGSNNNAECGYDGGDCCPGDCVDSTYACETYGGDCTDCADPDSADLAEGGQCADVVITCADTDCGYYLGYGYNCYELMGWGYDCSTCEAEGADCSAPPAGCTDSEYDCAGDGLDCIPGSYVCDG
jgi:hypothetical protein